MTEKSKQLSYVQPGKNLFFTVGNVDGSNEVKTKPDKPAIEIEIQKILGYEPQPGLVKRVEEIMIEKNLKSVSDAMMFIND